MSEVFRSIPLGLIEIWPGSLRKDADRKSLEYQQLRDTIKNIGFKSALIVRKSSTKPGIFEIVDGVQRFMACKDLGFTEIDCLVRDVEDSEMLKTQITANLHRVETKPYQYRAAIVGMLAADQTLTESVLAQQLATSPERLRAILQLDNIKNERTRSLINEGKMTLGNAFALSRLPAEEQDDWVDRALSLTNNELAPLIYARANEIKSAKAKGKEAAAPSFTPIAKLRALKDVENVLGVDLAPVIAAVTADGATDLTNIVKSTLRWAIRLDQQSVKEAKAAWDQRQAEKAETAKELAAKKEANKNKPKPEKVVTLTNL